jgi:hypothetical protein
VTALREIPPGEAIPDGNTILKSKNSKRFGQKGYVTIRKKILNKMESKSTIMFMVGYAANHATDTYLMLFNPDTNSVVKSRDVRWMCGASLKTSDWRRNRHCSPSLRLRGSLLTKRTRLQILSSRTWTMMLPTLMCLRLKGASMKLFSLWILEQVVKISMTM